MDHKWSTGYETLKLNVSEEWIVSMNSLFASVVS